MSEKLTMTVDIRAQLNQFNAAMDSAKEVLNKTFSGKGIKTYTDELNKIGRIFDKITRTTTGPIDSKATFAQMQKEVMDANQRLETLRDTISNIRNLTLTQKLTFLPDNFEQDFNKGKVAVSGFVSSIKEINKTKLNTEEYKTLNEEIKKLKDLSEGLQKSERNKEINENLKSETKVAEKEKEELTTLQQQLKAYNAKVEAQKQLNKLLSESGIKANSKNKANVLGAISGVTIPTEGTFKEDPNWTESQRKAKRKQWEDKRNNNLKNNDEIKKIASNYKLEEERVLKLIAANNKLQDSQVLLDDTLKNGGSESALKKETRTVEELDTQIKELNNTIEQNNSAIQKNEKENNNVQAALVKEGLKADGLEKQLEDLIKKREELNNTYDASKMQNVENATKSFLETIQKLGIDTSSLTDIETKSAEELRAWYTRAFDAQVATKELDDRIPELIQDIEALRDRAAETSVEIDKNSEAFDKLSERSENIDRLTARVKQFTGFVGVINLARKAMRDALSTVQELDKAMTSMAVVTKSTVSDYWEQLPKYTERANKLGATIRDMYEADTLYYQQGLKTNQVMQVANETMKMARIAGLGAAEATDRMTNALRGFNMAINEESAQRINDVYSKLAAITASNVDEISTAMTKTASIAHSAGMEFETTAAFLSQIIETTRESAETAGTALKTVIARFQELKKAPSEIGEVDGEIVDANKIEGALRTVGVALRDSEGQFRKLDDVFMELAGKWGSMDKNTQRYIATIAAGSRQQSRFIALMQDYSHTVELVDAAYTSAGTSQQQYEKTLESMETILKRLQNSWNTFTMGLFNSNLLKGFMKGGTELLNLLNKILDALDFTNLGIGKIAITAVGINKLGVAFKIFTNQLKQDNGTIANSFGAIGKSIGDWWVNFGKVKDNSNVATKATRDYLEAVTLSNIADKKAVETKKALEKETANLTRLTEQLTAQEANRSKAANMTRGKVRASEGRVGVLKDQDDLARIAKGNAGDVVAQTYENASKALMDYGKSLNLSNKASERFSELILQSNTALEDTERVTLLTTIATDENTASELLNNKERLAAMTTEELQQIVEEKHLVLRELTNAQLKTYTILNSKLIKVLTLGFSAKMADIALDKAKASSAGAATGAVKAFTVASLASLAAIGLVVAAVGALVLAFKTWQKNKIENQIEAAKERVDELNESLKDCKEALKDLEDQQEKYNSIKEELDKNVQGTVEWKKKLLEVNELVYDLIQKYPILASYVSRTRQGELGISDEGWDAALNQQNQRTKNVQVALYSAQERSYALEIKQSSDKILKKLNDIGYGREEVFNAVQGMGYVSSVEDIIEKLRLANETNPNDMIKYILRNIDEDKQWQINALEDLISPLNEIQGEIDETNLILNSIKESISPGETATEKAAGSVLVGAEQREKLSSERMRQLTKDFNDKHDYKDSTYVQEIAAYIAKTNGVTLGSLLSNNDAETLSQLYAGFFGGKAEDYKKRARWLPGNDRKKMIEEIITAYENLKINDSVSGRLKGLSEKELNALASINSKNMTREDAKTLDFLSKIDNDLGKELTVRLEKDNIESFSNVFEEKFSKITESLSRETIQQLNAFADKGFSLEQIEQFGRIIQDQLDNKGNAFNYARILEKTGGAEMLQSFLNFDTTSLEDLDKAQDTLIQNWPTLTEEIKSMIAQTKALSNAIHKIDLKTLTENTKNLAPILNSLTLEQHGNIYSEDEYNKLISSGVAKERDFLMNADGQYVLLTPMEQLKAAIEANTAALLNETSTNLDEQFELAESYREFLKNPASFSNKPYYSPTDNYYGDFLKNNSDLIKAVGISQIQSYDDYMRLKDTKIGEEFRKALEELKDTLTESEYKTRKEEIEKNLDLLNSTKGTTAMSYARYDRGEIDEDALRTRLGTDEFDREIDILNEFGESAEENKKRYNEFMKDIANKKSIESAEKNLKTLLGDVQSFSEEYEQITDDNLKYAKTLEVGTTVGLKNITQDNYTYYANLFDLVSEGSQEAYELLIKAILTENGIVGEAQEAMLTQADTEWTRFGVAQYNKMVSLANMLQNIGLGYTKANGQGGFNFNLFNGIGSFLPNAGGGGKEDEWEDPYNWLWNINKRINKEIFERERLERRYQKAVEDATKSEEELYEVSKKELENLERQATLERDKGQKAMQEAQMMMKQRPEFGKYVSWNAENGQIQVDYNRIDKENWGSARGEAFEAFVSRLEELNDEVQDSQTTLEEIEDLTEDIKNRGRDQYIELQDRIKNALVEINQREIDTAQKINDSIKTAQEELLNKIQEEISETRQIRSNQEKEQELEDKRQRLSYLRRDTTGANAVQIRQLEEELRKGEQSYTDSLTDQTLQNIQKANQRAEEQRAEEIEIMNNQLTRWQETGAIWDTVNTSIQEGFNNPDSFLNSNVASLIASAENRRALSEIQQADWDKDLENQAKLAELFNNGQLYQQGELTLESVKACQSELYQTMTNTGVLGNVNQNMAELLKVYPKNYADKIDGVAGGVSKANLTLSDIAKELGIKSKSIADAIKDMKDKLVDAYYKGLENKYQISIQRYDQNPQMINGHYATGGLNTTTGPAWLDGTPTKPEYVLNADQTKAFFNLVNTLTSDSSKGGVSGDNYFDIDINVDELSNDYDVDQLAARIKEQIWEDSQYRNVNLVNLLR